MPYWSSELPTEKKHMGFSIKRTPPVSAVRAIVTCDELLVCDTHWYGGRTVPCERIQQLPNKSTTAGTCQACNASIPYRTHVYVSALDCKSREHYIFECTANAAKAFQEYRENTTTLKGCLFNAFRPKAHRTGRVVIETATANLSRIQLPDPPNIVLALSVIWRLPLTDLAIEHQRPDKPNTAPKKDSLDRMKTQPDNMPEPVSIGAVLAGDDGRKPQAKAK